MSARGQPPHDFATRRAGGADARPPPGGGWARSVAATTRPQCAAAPAPWCSDRPTRGYLRGDQGRGGADGARGVPERRGTDSAHTTPRVACARLGWAMRPPLRAGGSRAVRGPASHRAQARISVPDGRRELGCRPAAGASAPSARTTRLAAGEGSGAGSFAASVVRETASAVVSQPRGRPPPCTETGVSAGTRAARVAADPFPLRPWSCTRHTSGGRTFGRRPGRGCGRRTPEQQAPGGTREHPRQARRDESRPSAGGRRNLPVSSSF